MASTLRSDHAVAAALVFLCCCRPDIHYSTNPKSPCHYPEAFFSTDFRFSREPAAAASVRFSTFLLTRGDSALYHPQADRFEPPCPSGGGFRLLKASCKEISGYVQAQRTQKQSRNQRSCRRQQRCCKNGSLPCGCSWSDAAYPAQPGSCSSVLPLPENRRRFKGRRARRVAGTYGRLRQAAPVKIPCFEDLRRSTNRRIL